MARQQTSMMSTMRSTTHRNLTIYSNDSSGGLSLDRKSARLF